MNIAEGIWIFNKYNILYKQKQRKYVAHPEVKKNYGDIFLNKSKREHNSWLL